MTFFIQNIFNALQWGSFYSMIALGYCLVYGVLRLINFAHGDIFMTSTYIAFFVVAFVTAKISGLVGIPLFVITLVCTMALTALLGVGIEKVAYKPLRAKGANRLYVVITALMIGFILENGNLAFLGASARSFPDILPKYVWNIGPVTITSLKVLVIVSAVLIFAILQFIVQKTTLGMSMRAISCKYSNHFHIRAWLRAGGGRGNSFWNVVPCNGPLHGNDYRMESLYRRGCRRNR